MLRRATETQHNVVPWCYDAQLCNGLEAWIFLKLIDVFKYLHLPMSQPALVMASFVSSLQRQVSVQLLASCGLSPCTFPHHGGRVFQVLIPAIVAGESALVEYGSIGAFVGFSLSLPPHQLRLSAVRLQVGLLFAATWTPNQYWLKP